MVQKKRQSKRVSLKMKHKMERKVKEHHKKLRREARKHPGKGTKLSKDPGIPNLHPFKTQLLKTMAKQRKLVERSEAVHQRRAQEIARRRKMNEGAGADPLAAMAASARARGSAFDLEQERKVAEAAAAIGADPSVLRAAESNRRAFYRHLRTVIQKADVILEVLDARDPMGCRVPALESLLLAQGSGKRVVLVLNKIDLVPAEVVRQWLIELRKEFPTIAFKASTQNQKSNLAAPGGARVGRAARAGEAVTGAGAAGAETLLQLIKNYSRNHKLKTAVTVGVIGYPNVGKSSLINSLKRGRAVGVSSTPGSTKAMQEVHIDSKVKLLDCPGVIFDDDSRPSGSLLLRNVMSVDAMDDPERAVGQIMMRCSPTKLMAHFAIPTFTSVSEFLVLIAQKRNKVLKGGIPDKTAAARSVLHDWNSGRIPFFTKPPKTRRVVGEATVVEEWGKEFNVDDMVKGEDDVLSSLPVQSAASFLDMGVTDSAAQGRGAAAFLASTGDDDDDDDDDSGDDFSEEDVDGAGAGGEEDSSDSGMSDGEDFPEGEGGAAAGAGGPAVDLDIGKPGKKGDKPVRPLFSGAEAEAAPSGTKKQQRALKKKAEKERRRGMATTAAVGGGAGAGAGAADGGGLAARAGTGFPAPAVPTRPTAASDPDAYDFSRDFYAR